jgi:putative transcriptional regulator
LLVASRTLTDPKFAQTVVLLVEHGTDGAAGLVVNAPSGVPVSRVFEHLKLPARSAATAFIGGPVTPNAALALVRSRTAVSRARLVIRDIHLVTTREPIETRLTAGADPREFRLYLGHAGWGAGQLEREIALDAWHVFDADSEVVFDADPATAWRRQIRRTELLEASLPRAVAAR